MYLRLFLLIGLLALVVGCAASSQSTAAGGARSELAGRKIRVVTTVGMITDAVRQVGGDRVEVTGLMGPGVDPHLYKPSASDIRKLEAADIIFYGGLELEGRMTDTFVKMARAGKPTVAVTEGIDESKLREPPEFEGKFDPHVWFDVLLWQDAVRVIGRELTKIDPPSGTAYARSTETYVAELTRLHDYVTTRSALIPAASRVLISAHDAFGYFGDRYGFEVRGLQGTSTATEAGAGDVQELVAFIVDRKVKAIFVETSVPPATIEAVQASARARGWNVALGGALFSDALGADDSPEGTYIGMVRHNIDTIVEALK